MFSKNDYKLFSSKLNSIVDDTFVEEPNKSDLQNNFYFVKRGLWPGTEEQIYIYDNRRLPVHKKSLLSLCKTLPKFHKPSHEHAGTISSFDLLIDQNKHPDISSEELAYQMVMANHFANLVEATKIASIFPAQYKGYKAFLIAIDSKYREYIEKDGIEPADN